MFKRDRILKVSCLAYFVFAVVYGCATPQLDSPEKKYLAARAELNLLLEQYIQIQDDVSDRDHENMAIAFQSADAVLDAWEPFASDSNYDFVSDYQAWIRIKSNILQILKEIYDE